MTRGANVIHFKELQDLATGRDEVHVRTCFVTEFGNQGSSELRLQRCEVSTTELDPRLARRIGVGEGGDRFGVTCERRELNPE